MIQLPFIEPGATSFPATSNALEDPNGLLAFGGDLSPQQLFAAYRKGIFPWFDDESPILWWSPSPRLVLKPSQLHVSKSMRKLLRQRPFTVTTDKAFEAVITACAEPREDQGTWITEEMIAAYCELHHHGIAHSIEVWEQDTLVGGLYGVAIGSVYFGESMFSLRSNASKYGFISLVEQLDRLNYQLIDCQVHTNHLASLGAEEVSRPEFESILKDAVNMENRWPTSEQVNQPLVNQKANGK
ncbi:MAG: leucyl/phenylalanyl-tRNA--protein transferase [Candidatus Pelagadaptatus aseana]|uniref:leucyl/phenylalanyl-tRNA--protein transferase n=1 Tax=Candidatus Pelagadaptatus aseana TaxID=3120508 RepID=UPI0039B1BC0A